MHRVSFVQHGRGHRATRRDEIVHRSRSATGTHLLVPKQFYHQKNVSSTNQIIFRPPLFKLIFTARPNRPKTCVLCLRLAPLVAARSNHRHTTASFRVPSCALPPLYVSTLRSDALYPPSPRPSSPPHSPDFPVHAGPDGRVERKR